MTRPDERGYSSFSTGRRRRFGVNLALTLDRLARSPAPVGWSAVVGVICLLLPPRPPEGGTAWGLHPIGAEVVEPGVEVKLRLLDALDWQRLRASGLCSCGGAGPKDHAFSRAGLIAEHARRAAPGRPRRGRTRRAAPGRPRRGRTPGAKRGRARRRAAPLLILNAAQFGSALRKSVSALSTRRSRRVRATPSRTMSMPPMIWMVILSDRMAAPRMTATMGSR